VKQQRRSLPGALGLGLFLLAACWSPVASAKAESSGKKAKSAASARPTPRPAKSRNTAKPKRDAKPAATPPATAASKVPDAPAAGRNEAVPAGVTKATEAPSTQAVVNTEENASGVKTFTFGAQEIEGRLKSPQILYFLRRVRAEFDPQPLGHRSFLLELSDTRRNPALR
jgi:hypothetical protein